MKVLALLGLFVSPLLGQTSVTISLPRALDSIAFVDSVIDELVALADTSVDETVRCLLGRVRGSDIMVYLAVTPRMSRRDRTSVNYAPCPIETVALWHNHTPVPGVPNVDRCFLSRADINAAVHELGPILQIVMVRDGFMCWWSKDQVFRENTRMILQPIGTQVYQRTRQ